jgi:probable rRNA maturation factor
MTVTVDIQLASAAKSIPALADMERWVNAAVNDSLDTAEVSIRIVDEDEITALNSTYRKKSASTNVLSFPADLPDEIDIPLLGDIIICAPVVEREAAEQQKEIGAHWAHMLIHGTLHLLGYDHAQDQEASEMEAKETNILQALDFPPPYQ